MKSYHIWRHIDRLREILLVFIATPKPNSKIKADANYKRTVLSWKKAEMGEPRGVADRNLELSQGIERAASGRGHRLLYIPPVLLPAWQTLTDMKLYRR